MGTEKRERQKANRAKRREEELKAARVTKAKRTVLRWVVAGVLALAAVILIAFIGGAFDGDDSDAPTPASSLLPITIPVDATTVPASTVPGSTTPATSTTAP